MDGESPRLPKQNTLWAKLSFDPKVLDETKDVEKKDSVGAFLSTVPIRMSRLVASLTPWTSMLHEIDFRDEEENAQGQRLRKFGNVSDGRQNERSHINILLTILRGAAL